MIIISELLSTLLQEPLTESFFLVKIGSLRKTNFYRDITHDSELYLADGSLQSVEPPRLTSIVDKASFKIILNDPSVSLGSATFLDANGVTRNLLGAIGHLLSVRMCFVDQTTKQPILTPADTLLVYVGRIDSTGFSIKTDSVGEVDFVITGTSPMGDLDLTRAFYTSQDFANKHFPEDTSYEQVYEGSGPINLRWGKK